MTYKTLPPWYNSDYCLECDYLLFFSLEDMIVDLGKIHPSDSSYKEQYEYHQMHRSYDSWRINMNDNHNNLFDKVFGRLGEFRDYIKVCPCCGHKNWYNFFHDELNHLVINRR